MLSLNRVEYQTTTINRKEGKTMEGKNLTISEIFGIVNHSEGTEYCISVNGQCAVNQAKKIIGNKCYQPIFQNSFIGQIEITIDEPGEYNGLPKKWVSISFIPHNKIDKVISWLQDNGFSDMLSVIQQEDPQDSDFVPDFPEYRFIVPTYNKNQEETELDNDKIVVFDDNGKTVKISKSSNAARFEKRFNLWKTPVGDDNNRYFIYSDKVIDKPHKEKRKFIPSAENCTVRIIPDYSTEKAFAIVDGSNGLIGKGCKIYYKFIAKSVCYIDETGNIFAPIWAVK